jgi:hypothetical protein
VCHSFDSKATHWAALHMLEIRLMEYVMMSHYNHDTRRFITSMMQQVTLRLWRNTFFQQDGAPLHYTLRLLGFLIEGLTNWLDKEQSNGHRGHQTSRSSISYSGAIWSLLPKTIQEIKQNGAHQKYDRKTSNGCYPAPIQLACAYHVV